MAKSGRRKGSKGRGWGVLFPKVSRKTGGFTQAIHGPRTDDDLVRLQREWSERYTARVRAHRLLGVSMGTPLEDAEESHRLLVARLPLGDPRREELNKALHLVQATAEVGNLDRPSDATGTAVEDLDDGGDSGLDETDAAGD